MKEEYRKPAITSGKEADGVWPLAAAVTSFIVATEMGKQIRNALSDARPLQSLKILQLCPSKGYTS